MCLDSVMFRCTVHLGAKLKMFCVVLDLLRDELKP
jgi:hypothetical protein